MQKSNNVDWKLVKDIWEKNQHPSSRKLLTILQALKIKTDDGTIRTHVRKWRNEIYQNELKVKEKYKQNIGEHLWDFCTSESKIRQQRLSYNPSVITLNTKKPVAIAFIADQHLGSYDVDYEQAAKDAIDIANTPNMYAVFGGDSIDNFIKLSISSAMLESPTAPSEQIELLEYYFAMFKGKILALVSGNHELWLKEISSFDLYKHIANTKIVPTIYAPFIARLEIFVNDISYRVMLRHKYRFNSSFNLTHSVKRMYDMSDYQFDIGVVCHHHKATFEPFQKHGEQRWAVRTGTYKTYDSFAAKIGFNGITENNMIPIAILYPNSKKIEMVGSVEAAKKLIS